MKYFKGVLVTDGYLVYHTLSDSQEDLVVAGCWSHARRRFAEIVKMLKDKKQARNTLAYAALEQIKAIYKVEESLKSLSSEERRIRRHLSVEPLVESFFAWLKAHQFDVPENRLQQKESSTDLTKKNIFVISFRMERFLLITTHLNVRFVDSALARKTGS